MTLVKTYLIVAIIIFITLALMVRVLPHYPLDLAITHTLQAQRSPGLDILMQAISWPGYPPQLVFLLAMAVVFIYALRFRWEAVMTGLSAGSAQLLSGLLKAMIQRPRPPADLVYTFESMGDFGFPSGHVMFYLGFFGFLGFLSYRLLAPSWKRLLLLLVFTIPVVLVGLSRLYLGLHWASDILGAYLGGSLVLILAIQLYQWGAPHFSSSPSNQT
jgi:membrane-associated phospholipid phosphatase